MRLTVRGATRVDNKTAGCPGSRYRPGVRILLLCLVAVGCGHPAPATAPAVPDNTGGDVEPAAVLLTLETGACMGACPIYRAVLRDDGSFVFDGIENVVSLGEHASQFGRDTVAAVVDAFAAARFAELDDDGNLPKEMDCVTTPNGVTTCTGGSAVGCSDTSHTRVTYGGRTIDDPHCVDTDLRRLEDKGSAILQLHVWIAGRD
jgi:hypothetical protein